MFWKNKLRQCPHPIIADHSAKACIAAGNCGCDEFYKPENHSEETIRKASREMSAGVLDEILTKANSK